MSKTRLVFVISGLVRLAMPFRSTVNAFMVGAREKSTLGCCSKVTNLCHHSLHCLRPGYKGWGIMWLTHDTEGSLKLTFVAYRELLAEVDEMVVGHCA